MLSVLRSQLDLEKREMVLRFDYKNLAPLYVDEKMWICTRRNPDNPHKFDVWIEGKEGGYAVKATAEVGPELDRETDPELAAPSVGPDTEMRSILKSEPEPEPEAERKQEVKPAPKRKSAAEHFSRLINVFQGKRTGG